MTLQTFRQHIGTKRLYELDMHLPAGDAHPPVGTPSWAIVENLGVEGETLGYALADIWPHTGGLAASIDAKARGKLLVGVTFKIGDHVTRTERFAVDVAPVPDVASDDVKTTFTQRRLGAGASH
jgi:hypothetical protein